MFNAGSTRFGWLLGIVMGGAIGVSANCVSAQITPDGTLPSHSNVTINGSVINITGGTQAGRNLFHSFQQFSVPTGGTAIFNNGLDIQNIISRVTGTSSSMIDGLIKASGTANLFFLNPNGIVFGPHASLSVNGSFVATTANAIQFGFQGSFSASAPNNPALLTVDPSALLFNQIVASPIQNNSNPSGASAIGLRVPDGKSLLLVGGDINMDSGNLNAFGGHVELGGLAGSGTLGLNVDGNNLSLSFPDGVERASVSLKNSSHVDVSGGGSGSIAINARNLDLQQSSLKADISPSFETPSLRVGDITVNASQAIKLGQSSRIESSVLSNARGNGSNINITTDSLSIIDTSEVNTFTFGQGNAGKVNVNARDLSFDGASNGMASGIVSVALQQSTGNAGNISINTETLSLTKGAQVSTISNGQGSTGSVTINASDRVSLDGMQSEGMRSGVNTFNNSKDSRGNNGGISITTGSLTVRNGAQLNTNTNGMGNAGDVNINARDTVEFDGASNGLASGIVSIAQQSTGKAGNISINTGTLSLTKGAGVSAISNGKGSTGSVTLNARDRISLDGARSGVYNLLNSNGIGNRNSGGISITAGTLSITNGAQLNTSTNGTGNAGDVMIEAGNLVSFNQGLIFTSANEMARGKAGDISIKSGDISLTKAQLNTATSGMGNAGNVMIEARDRVSLNNSMVFMGVNPTAIGKGGDISIKSGDISLANGSLIILSTTGKGDAGNARLTTRSLSLTDGSLLTASSSVNSLGNAGDIHIEATESVSLSGHSPINNRSTEISSDTLETSKGNGGNITIDTNAFRLSDGAIINARTTSNGTGGNITINSKTFEAINGGELVSTSSSSTSAGKITVHATDWVSVNGSDPTVETRRNMYNSSNANLANVEAASGFFVQSSGSGSAGDIEVNAPQIRLDNSGKFSAQSALGNGGNINLLLGDLLLLRRQSLISTSAGSHNFPGNGGNITINAPSGFIVAIPNENSDITANAFEGSGGKVQIQATGVYNIAPLSRQDLERLRPSDLDPRQLPTNDITAISQQNPSLSGQVTVTTPNIDRSQGLLQLPIVVNTPKPVSSNCAAFANSEGGSSFTVTGRGGLPPSPDEPLTSDAVWLDARLPVATVQHQYKTHASKPKPKPIAIVPATGWVLNDQGEVMLISSAHSATSLGSTPTCPIP